MLRLWLDCGWKVSSLAERNARMAANHWQSAAAEYAEHEMERYTELSAIARSEITRLIAAAFRAGALAGFDRAEEIRREVMGK